MQKVWAVIKEAVRNVDPILFLCATLLSLISILTIFGAVDNFGVSKLKMQVFIFAVGTLLTIAVAFVDFKSVIDRFGMYLLAGSVLLLLLTLLVGTSGANRETANKSWLAIPGTGFMIQPSEFIKFTFVCTFSKHLYAVRDHINRPLTILFLLAHALLIVGPILLSGDLGVALVYIAIIALMLFCAGLHPLYFLGATVILILLSPYLWECLAEYQKERIIVGFRPELDPAGKGMQPLLSRTAIGAGSFFGAGLFGGSYYEVLPASHTDFIFATVCEKFGFFGGAIVILLFMVMVVRIFMIARTASRSDYGGLICVGVGSMLVIQILLNLGMCFAVLPVIGITLPLLSCGGSSMLATFMMLGLVYNVSAHSRACNRKSAQSSLDMDYAQIR